MFDLNVIVIDIFFLYILGEECLFGKDYVKYL